MNSTAEQNLSGKRTVTQRDICQNVKMSQLGHHVKNTSCQSSDTTLKNVVTNCCHPLYIVRVTHYRYACTVGHRLNAAVTPTRLTVTCRFFSSTAERTSMVEFFMPMIPPTVTAQEHKVTVRNGKPVFYDTPELKNARQKLTAYLAQNKPKTPFDKSVRLTVKWLFPSGKRHADGEYKSTRPDTDNLQKLLKDCMTKAGFWKDDAVVASEIVEKFYAKQTGIYVRIERIDEL